MSGKLLPIKYRDGMHEIFFCDAENIKKIRLYPQKNKFSQLKFGRFNPEKCLKPKLFLTQPMYTLKDVDFAKFVSENILIVKQFGITMICFHPRESNKFKELIKQELNFCTFFDGINTINDLETFACISACSTVCFDQVALGNDAFLIPFKFPSLGHVESIRNLTNYLEDLSKEETL